VPLCLLWIYLSGLIVLFGAEVVCNLGISHQWRKRAVPRLLVVLGVLRVFHERQQSGFKVRLRDVQRQGWMLAEYEWEDVLEFLEQQQLIASTGAGTWVLSRDLGHYTLAQLLSRSPWPLPRLAQLPEQLDEPWYPALRSGLEKLHEEQLALFGESLAQWLHPDVGPAE
jgi:membrane protein